MNAISNQNNCGDGSKNGEIASSYIIHFYVEKDGKYFFHVPVDYGSGGMVLMDGEQVSHETTDIW